MATRLPTARDLRAIHRYVHSLDEPHGLSRPGVLAPLLTEVAARATDAESAAAALAYAIVTRQPFAEANRRTAGRAARLVLELNGKRLDGPALRAFYDLLWVTKTGPATEADLEALLRSVALPLREPSP